MPSPATIAETRAERHFVSTTQLARDIGAQRHRPIVEFDGPCMQPPRYSAAHGAAPDSTRIMQPEAYDQVVAAVYDAAEGAGSWHDALTMLATELRLWCVHLCGLDRTWTRMLFRHQAGTAPPLATLDYLRRYHEANPSLKRSRALAVGHWLHSHVAFEDDFVARDAFFQEFLIPHGGRHISSAKVVDDDRAVVLLTVVRAVGMPPLASDEIALLDRINLHLGRAMCRGVDLKRTTGDESAPKRLLDQFGYPMFLVDEHRAIRARNAAAQGSVGAAGYLEERNGMLACRDPECDLALAQAVRALHLTSAPSATLPTRRFARLKKSDGSPVGLYAVALRPDAAMGMFGPLPLALLIFHDPQQQTALDPFVVAEMFDLSPAEAKVAVLLALGRSPDEIAASGRISVSTVRAQIKAIFAKTGVSRQSELVALLRGMPGVTRLGA